MGNRSQSAGLQMTIKLNRVKEAINKQGRMPSPTSLAQSYISKGMWRQGIGSFVRNSYVSTLCPVVICPCCALLIGSVDRGRWAVRSVLIITVCKFQIEGLKSQNHCLCSLPNALWKFKSPRGWAHSSRLNFWKLGASWRGWKDAIEKRYHNALRRQTMQSDSTICGCTKINHAPMLTFVQAHSMV